MIISYHTFVKIIRDILVSIASFLWKIQRKIRYNAQKCFINCLDDNISLTFGFCALASLNIIRRLDNPNVSRAYFWRLVEISIRFHVINAENTSSTLLWHSG